MKVVVLLVALCLIGTATARAYGPNMMRGMDDGDMYQYRPLAYPPPPQPAATPYRFRETAAQQQQQQAAMRQQLQEQDSLEFGSAAAAAAAAGVDASMMVQNNRCPSGNTFLKCPFASGTCCGAQGMAQACCPTGYGCNQRAAGWHCVAGSASTQHQPASRPVTSISPTIVVTNGANNNNAAPSTTVVPKSSASTTSDGTADDRPSGNNGSQSPRSSASSSEGSNNDGDDAFKPKQNIIIVKNINVLTKGVAPASSLANKDSDK